jgi:hypothetical protein
MKEPMSFRPQDQRAMPSSNGARFRCLPTSSAFFAPATGALMVPVELARSRFGDTDVLRAITGKGRSDLELLRVW